MKKIAIIAAGFAPKQSEITESISLILALSEFKAEFKIFAADTTTSLNHHELHALDQLIEKDFDALVFPGGLGVATLLSNWLEMKENMQVIPVVEKTILSFYKNSKPIGAICLGPILLAKTLSKHNPQLTFGNSLYYPEVLKKWGINQEFCPSSDFITDRENKLITTPAYSNDEASPYEVYSGIRALAKELVEMA